MATGNGLGRQAAGKWNPATPQKVNAGGKRKRVVCKQDLQRKGSFSAVWDPTVSTHTLLLGTQPSDNSLAHGQYFMTNENAYWHIVGDALGFRRGFFVGSRTEAPDFIRPHLLHTEVVSYDEALARLLARGYAMWDIVASSVRPGSLDSDIQDAEYADVPGFVQGHCPQLERIVFSTGAASARIFLKAHRQSKWFQTPGLFRPAADEASMDVFGAWCKKHALPAGSEVPSHVIELVVTESVSPAANPRQTWTVDKQRAKSVARVAKGLPGFDDLFSRRPAAVYPWKRADWFAKVFFREEAVKLAPPFGSVPSHFRQTFDREA
mmetsp:Transcript_51260/g.133109  ORF Transcript_51260/g.133109 Transcript_51260/m.133109 type:complete len:322 (+) Transcript_51260:129-1094(+)